MAITPRMDGSPLEQAHWRISALREALEDVYNSTRETPVREITLNALRVDEMNAATMRRAD